MARITREQVEKMNAQAKNGFKFDIEYFLIHHEKTLTKIVVLNESQFVRFKLMFEDERENADGWRRPTGRQIPNIHISLWNNSRGFASSHGLGTWEKIGEPVNKKSFALLCKLSAEVDTGEFLKKLDYEKLTDGRIL